MRSSKARDISQVAVGIDPLHLPEYPLRLSVSPRVGRDLRKMSFDFTSLAPLGKYGGKLVAVFVAACRDFTSDGWTNLYYALKPFCVAIARETASQPWLWTSRRWKAFADAEITAAFTAEGADGSKNLYRAHVATFTKAGADLKVIPPFRLRSSIKKPSSTPKVPLAEAPVIGQYSELHTPKLTSAAERLQALAQTLDPSVHMERHSILMDLLVSDCEQRIRAEWQYFRDMQRIILSPVGLNANEFVQKHVTFDCGMSITEEGYKLLRGRDSLLRLLAHPEVYPHFLQFKLPRRLKSRIFRNGGVGAFHRGLHLTLRMAVPCLTLLLADLNNECSSALGMRRRDFSATDNRKVMRVSWYKTRSHEQQEEFRDRGSVRALHESDVRITSYLVGRVLNIMRRRLRKFAPAGFQEHLFLVAYPNASPHNIGNVLSNIRATDEFHRIRNEHPILSKHKFSLDKIRGSIVLNHYLKTGNLISTARLARHKDIGTTMRYVNHATAHVTNNSYVREMQDLLLLATLPQNPELTKRMGVDEDRANALWTKAKASSFFEWCFGTPPQKVDPIVESRFRRLLMSGEMFVIEHPEVAAEVFAYRRHLLAQAPKIRGSAEWYETGAPLLLLINKTWSLIRPDIRLEGERLAEQYQLEYMEVA